MSDLGSLFEYLSRRPYHDETDLAVRTDHLSIYLLDIENATHGLITTKGLINADSILDLGMGKGALGVYLRSQGMTRRLVGVDCYDYRGEGPTGYDLYNRIVTDVRIEALVDRGGLHSEIFDYVLCIAPSQDLLDWTLANSGNISLGYGGRIVIATERRARVDHEFNLYNGVSMLENIYLR